MDGIWWQIVLPSKAEYPNVSLGRSDMAFACCVNNAQQLKLQQVPAGFKICVAKDCSMKWHCWRFRLSCRLKSSEGISFDLHKMYQMPSFFQAETSIFSGSARASQANAEPHSAASPHRCAAPCSAAVEPRSRLSALKASWTHNNPQRAIQHITVYYIDNILCINIILYIILI